MHRFLRPATPAVDRHLVSLTAPSSFAAEQYQGLRLTIERLARTREMRVVAVSSPAAGDGKTVTAINLAGALARGTADRVLLIDGDLRRPSVARQLGVPDATIGLADALLTDGVFAQCADPNRVPSVSVKDPEHWELDLGPAAGPWRRLDPGIYERSFTQGVVVANLGRGAYRHTGGDGRTRTIPAHDALIAQTKNASGPLVPWITTSNR